MKLIIILFNVVSVCKMKLIISGILIHLIFMGAIFDLYFKSTISGIQSQKNDRKPPAKRLVLFIADGLRAESLYGTNLEHMMDVSPHLCRKVKSHRAAWGISHSRVPTITRPKLVALTAGIYENPNVVFNIDYWKKYPVDVDTVFDESFHSWAWGESATVRLFTKSENVEGYSLDFSGKKETDRVVKLFIDHHSEDTVKLLHSDKIIFCLHLVGIDLAGHAYNPGSRQYKKNIRDVDSGIIKIEQAMELYYGDNETAFIFTSDHGMTDWGSHGAGSTHETETPIIVWGAGVKPNGDKINITQVDITPLISTLIGIPIPVNSIGVLPTDVLNMSDEDKAHALFLNAKQIYAQFYEIRRRTETNSVWFLYTPYCRLSNQEYENITSVIESSLKNGDYEYVMNSSASLIKTSLEGLDYYQNYYQRILLSFVTLMFLGWIGILIIHLTKPSKEKIITHKPRVTSSVSNYIRGAKLHNIILHVVFICAMIAACLLLYVQSLPLMYYVYFTLPLYIWWYILETSDDWVPRAQSLFVPLKRFALIMGEIILYICGVETLVACFFCRKSLSLTLFIMAFWPFFLRKVNYLVKFAWMTSCFALAIFPFLPVVEKFYINLELIIVTAVVWILVSFGFLVVNYFTVYPRSFCINKNQMCMAIFQSLLLAISVFNLYSADVSIRNKLELIWYNQYCSWIVSALAIIASIFGSNKIVERLINISMGLLIPFTLMSIHYEPLFLLTLFLNLLLWLYIEHVEYSLIGQNLTDVPFSKISYCRTITTNMNQIHMNDFRRGLFILVYAFVANFGMCNITNFVYFDLAWTRNFITDYSPYIMTGLILFKLLIPFLVVTCVFRAVTTCIQAPVYKIFFIVLIFCDIMAIQFLFMVENTGTWFEIGSSISHYIIVQTVAICLLFLYVLALPLTSCDLLGLLRCNFSVKSSESSKASN